MNLSVDGEFRSAFHAPRTSQAKCFPISFFSSGLRRLKLYGHDLRPVPWSAKPKNLGHVVAKECNTCLSKHSLRVCFIPANAKRRHDRENKMQKKESYLRRSRVTSIPPLPPHPDRQIRRLCMHCPHDSPPIPSPGYNPSTSFLPKNISA